MSAPGPDVSALLYTMALNEAHANDQKELRLPDWARLSSHDDQDLTCAYCGQPVSRRGESEHARGRMDPLIPLRAGGTRDVTNMVIACSICVREKRNRDWISFGRAVDRKTLLDRREASLLLALNHVLPLSIRNKTTARAAFRERWRAPRFKVHAGLFRDGGLIAWDTHDLPPQTNGAMRLTLEKRFDATIRFSDRVMQFLLPQNRFHDAIWILIEGNALVERIAFSDHASIEHDMLAPDDLEHEHFERWHVLLTGNRWLDEASKVDRWGRVARARAKVLRPMWICEQQIEEDRARKERIKAAGLDHLRRLYANDGYAKGGAQ